MLRCGQAVGVGAVADCSNVNHGLLLRTPLHDRDDQSPLMLGPTRKVRETRRPANADIPAAVEDLRTCATIKCWCATFAPGDHRRGRSCRLPLKEPMAMMQPAGVVLASAWEFDVSAGRIRRRAQRRATASPDVVASRYRDTGLLAYLILTLAASIKVNDNFSASAISAFLVQNDPARLS